MTDHSTFDVDAFLAATDLTKYRCAAKNTSTIGTRLITLPAISSVHWVACVPWK